MSEDNNELAQETIELLESRLRRLEYIVGSNSREEDPGHQAQGSESNRTVTERLARLEGGLGHLASRSKPVQDLLALRETSPANY